MKDKFIKLLSGYELPVIGLDMSLYTTQHEIDRMLTAALRLGYRHFDTASAYHNEIYIGKFFDEIFSAGELKRKDVFITTKLYNSDHFNVKNALHNSLKNLQLSYLDCYYINWPVTYSRTEDGFIKYDKHGIPQTEPFRPVRTWLEMERYTDCNKIKSLGCCHFGPYNYTQIKRYANTIPSVLQIECHPFLLQNELVDLCNDNGTGVFSIIPSYKRYEKYDLYHCCTIQKISEKYSMTPMQVILSFNCMRGLGVITQASTIEELEHNISFMSLDPIDFEKIMQLQQEHRFIVPSFFNDDCFQ
ncbi:hypothetical protein COBT_000564 [Conglomerata obtusa]